jgi:hypothetical protein
MATKKSDAAARSYSLITDQKFQQMHAAMMSLRTSARRSATLKGAEASIVGTTIDLRPSDLILAPAHLLPEALLVADHLYFPSMRKPTRKSLLENSIPVVSSVSAPSVLTIAAGAALGRHTTKNESVIVAFGTTDAANRDAWLAAFHLAGKHRLPILFVLLPGDEVEAAHIGSKAVSAGVITVPVDTADVVAMYRVAFESLARARRRTSATLIVSTPYKLENEKPGRAEDPLRKMEIYLKNKGISLKPR